MIYLKKYFSYLYFALFLVIDIIAVLLFDLIIREPEVKPMVQVKIEYISLDQTIDQCEEVSIDEEIVTSEAPEEETSEEIVLSSEEEVVEEYSEELQESAQQLTNAHKYYKIIDKGYTYEMNYEWQDYLYEQLAADNKESYYELYVAMIYHESHFDPTKISATNDYGLCQINISNHGHLKKVLGVDDFLDPYQSIRCGIYMLNKGLCNYDSVESALVFYNQGHATEGETSDYSREVLDDMNKLVEIGDNVL